MSDTVLITVKDMINRAFGEPENNTVNFKLVQALLLLLAKQLRMLERQVGVEMDWMTNNSAPPTKVMNVKEVKVLSKTVSKTSVTSDHKSVDSKKKKKEDDIKEKKPDDNKEKKPAIEAKTAGKGGKKELERKSSSESDFNYERLFIVERIPEDTKTPKDNILSVVSDKEFSKLVKRVDHIEGRLGDLDSGVQQIKTQASKGSAPPTQFKSEDTQPQKDAQLPKATGKTARKEDEEEAAVESVAVMGTKAPQVAASSVGGASTKSAKTTGSTEIKISQTGLKRTTGALTFDDLQEAVHDVRRDIKAQMDANNNRIFGSIDQAMKTVAKNDAKIAEIQLTTIKIGPMEETIRTMVEQINTMDAGLASQLVIYQEQICTLQHDLEKAVDDMKEAIEKQGHSTVLNEINTNIATLQGDLEKIKGMQFELEDVQRALYNDIRAIFKDCEFLREAKSDRDEVADALRDKAGIADLNGMVALPHFEAVREELEKKIADAYERFYQYELVWQEAIDEIFKQIDTKVDKEYQEALKQSIQEALNKINAELFKISEILGEPRAAALERQLFRDTICMSCAAPAKMDLKKACPLPILPALLKPAVEKMIKEEGDGDHFEETAHTNPNPDIPPMEYCSRYCGGSHTKIGFNRFRVTSSLGLKVRKVRDTKTEVGTDGKLYQVDDSELCKPCDLPPHPDPYKQCVTK